MFLIKILIVMVFAFFFMAQISLANETLALKNDPLKSSTTLSAASVPNTCPYGKNMRIAMIQAGVFGDYIKVFRQMTLSLIQRGLVKKETKVTEDFDFNDKASFLELAQGSKGGCIEFLADGFYDGSWIDEQIDATTRDLKRRIKEQKDVDLVLAFGTTAGVNFADSSLKIPVMVVTPTDAESANIIGPGEFSDKKYIHVQKERDRYRSELLMFYDIFKFKKLGVVIDELPENQLAQAYPIILNVAKLKGFTVIPCMGKVFKDAQEGKIDTLKKCGKELAQSADAVYITVGGGTSNELYDALKPLYQKGIPTFSQQSDTDVARGVLLSLSDSQMREAGIFEANVLEQIYKGVDPQSISQNYYAPLNLAINMHTARLIGWRPDFEVLVAVDKVFQDVITKDTK